MTEREVWYRYDDVRYSAGVDECGDPLPYLGRMELRLSTWPVLRRTPCGAWLGWSEDAKKFVNLNWNKRFAVPTKEEALDSFIARKERQRLIGQRKVDDANSAIALAERIKSGKAPHVL